MNFALWLQKTNANLKILKTENLKNKNHQRGFKIKCSIDKKAILHKILFSVPLSNKILLLEIIFTYFQQHLRTKLT